MTVDEPGAIQLQVLGPVRVQRPGGQPTGSLLTQPRRLAVLAYLTLARPRGLHARDTLVALLWPESDEASGRHALRNALHAIRSTLGDPVIVTAGDGLVGVDPTYLSCDAVELEARAAARDWAGVLAAYHGELLQGFHVSDAPELERWLDAERDRFRRTVCAAAWSLSDECRDRGDFDAALHAARRAVDLAPDDELAVRRLLDLARLGGDRATALRAYDRFAERLATEYESEPSAETQRSARASRDVLPAHDAALLVSPASVGHWAAPVPEPTLRPPAAPPAAPLVSRTSAATVSSVAPHRGRRGALIGGLAVILAAALVTFVMPRLPATRAAVDPVLLAVGAATRITTDDGLEIQPELSPDGRFLAYVAGVPVRMGVFVRPLGGTRAIALLDDSMTVATAPHWSPDGSRLLYLAGGGVRVSPALGGGSQILIAGGGADTVLGAAWAPSGTEILFSRSDSVYRMPLPSGPAKLVGVAAEAHSCRWSVARPLIACVSGNRIFVQPTTVFANRAPSGIVVFPAAGGAPVHVTDPADRSTLNQSPTWSRDGKTLYFISDRHGTRDVYAVSIDPAGRAAGGAARLTTGLGAHSVALSADGRRIAYSIYSERANVFSLPIPARGVVAASSPTPVTTGNQVIESLRVTHDGKWLIYDSNIRGGSQIYRVRLPNGSPEQLTNDADENFRADLSPDERELVYQAWPSGSRDVYLLRLDRAAPRRQLTTTPGMEAGPLWSPDGRSLTFADIPPSGSGETYVIRRDSLGRWGERVAQGIGGPGSSGWSPDSRRLAVITVGAVRVVDVVTRRDTVLYAPRRGTDDPVFEQLVWFRDGRTIYLKSHDASGRATLWRMPAAGGRPEALVRFPDLRRPSDRPDFGTDGHRFYFAIQDRQSDVWVADLTR